MRLIGHLPTEDSAAQFSDYLYVEGISNVIESEKEGWAVWIHAEEQLDKARELLSGYRAAPNDAKFQRQARQARDLRKRDVAEEAAAEKRFFDRSRIFRATMGYRVGPLTIVLIALCVIVAVLSRLGEDVQFSTLLLIKLPEVFAGQVWRLITPIFLHLGLLHLLFNMLWLFDLGGMIERAQGTWRLALLVLVIGVASNVAQYLGKGPNFGGMSGVVYGLLGYVWMKGKNDPASGLFLHPQTVTMMLLWFFLGFTPVLPNIANITHGAGLFLGCAWGYLSSLWVNRQRP
jgi:GlpG protein